MQTANIFAQAVRPAFAPSKPLDTTTIEELVTYIKPVDISTGIYNNSGRAFVSFIAADGTNITVTAGPSVNDQACALDAEARIRFLINETSITFNKTAKDGTPLLRPKFNFFKQGTGAGAAGVRTFSMEAIMGNSQKLEGVHA